MFRISRKYLLGLMLGTAVLPMASCTVSNVKTAEAQQSGDRSRVITTSADDSLAHKYLRTASKLLGRSTPIGERVMLIGRMMKNTPYVASTLEVDSVNENLVMNLRGLDCVTFYENALAMARVVRMHPKPTVEQYREELKKLRYRGGKIDGYASRLHYSIDYFHDNVEKGVLRNVTQEVGGSLTKKDTRTIDFMSKHRSTYKQLRTNDEEYANIVKHEQEMNARGGFMYIPKESIAAIEKNIQPGDIIGIVTSINGLDCSHTGIAEVVEGTIHFTHASSALGKVVMSEGTLSEYLAPNSKQIGIVVMRPVEVPSGF